MPGPFWRLSLLTNEHNWPGPFFQPPHFRASSVPTGADFSQDYPPLGFSSALAPLAYRAMASTPGSSCCVLPRCPSLLVGPGLSSSRGGAPQTPCVHVSYGYNMRKLGVMFLGQSATACPPRLYLKSDACATEKGQRWAAPLTAGWKPKALKLSEKCVCFAGPRGEVNLIKAS